MELDQERRALRRRVWHVVLQGYVVKGLAVGASVPRNHALVLDA